MSIVATSIVGSAPEITKLKEDISLIAPSNLKVLITGPTGVGKDLVAKEVQNLSSLRGKPFVTVNCAGLPETLLEAELFGYAKGAFTGAYRDHKGKLEVANGGTIFLDEIGDMSLPTQASVLRFLESGEIQPLGEALPRLVHTRVIAATNKNLADMMEHGMFRKDLYYRLKVAHIEVPPLATHTTDIPELIRHFAQAMHNGNGNGHHLPVFAADALAVLTNYWWPGNVRQLKNLVELTSLYKDREVIQFSHLPSEIRDSLETDKGLSNAPEKSKEESEVECLYQRVTTGKESFWDVVYPLFMQRDITRVQLCSMVELGMKRCHGNCRQTAVWLSAGSDQRSYKKFLNFLRKHKCQLEYRLYR